MEEQLKNYGKELIELVKGWAEFAQEQAPLVIQEMLNYGMWYYAIITAIMLVIFAFSLFFFIKFIQFRSEIMDKPYMQDKDYYEGVIMLCGSLGIFSLFLFLYNLFGLIQVLIAPRVYVIEQLSNIFMQ